MSTPSPVAKSATERLSYVLGYVPFVGVHIAALVLAIVYGVTAEVVALAVFLYVVRLWGVTAGYHRYFSHRAFKTSRVFQFLLAFLAQTSSQKGALWWAAHHRHHHKHSDDPEDIHSPVQRGFWYSHLGWLFADTEATDYSRVHDFAKYPELVWLNRFWVVPPIALGTLCYLALGMPGLVGFFLSTVATWHGTFVINSLAHVFGKRRFQTSDHSRNSFLLAVVTGGEGWHNNHHHFQASARNGFYWWEWDPTYYVLVFLSWFGIVWDLRPVPERVLEEGRRLDAEARERGYQLPLPAIQSVPRA